MARSPRRGALAVVAALLLALAFAASASAATFNVDTTDDSSDADTGAPACADDDGKCSLRAAVEQANATAGDDVVDVPAGRYVLNGQIEVEAAEEGDTVTITGSGARSTVVDADGSGSAFNLLPESGLSGSGFTVTGGLACECSGGGAFVVGPEATLDLSDARLTRNQAVEGFGGAIASFGGTTSLTRVRLDHNEAHYSGGAVWSLGTLSIVDSEIEANSSQGDGGAISNEFLPFCECGGEETFAAPAEENPFPGALSITGTTLSDNKAGARGGAVYNNGIDLGQGGYRAPRLPTRTVTNWCRSRTARSAATSRGSPRAASTPTRTRSTSSGAAPAAASTTARRSWRSSTTRSPTTTTSSARQTT